MISIIVLTLFLPTINWVDTQKAPYIFHGAVTTIEEYPFIVSIRRDDIHRCGGTIITKSVILTAAHCLTTVPFIELTIRVGSSGNEIGTSYAVKDYQLHEEFNPWSAENDIALLTLMKQLKLGTTVQIAKLATKRLPDGTEVIIAGWGRVYFKSPVSRALRYSVMTTDSQEVCILQHADHRFAVTNTTVCASNRDGRNTCAGDSGGPMANAMTMEILGIISFADCGNTTGTAFVSVPDMLPWIKKYVKLD